MSPPAPRRTPATYTLWKAEHQRPGWQDREPPYLHSPKYHLDGIEHLTVVRANDVDTLWLEVRKVMQLVKAARAKAAVEAPPQPPKDHTKSAAAENDDQKGYCAIHNVWMKRHTKGDSA